MSYRIKQEQAINNANQKQMRSLEACLVSSESSANYAKAIQNLLDEKNNIIQDLKKKLNIPATHVIQTNELAEVERERDQIKENLLDTQDEVVELKQERMSLYEKMEQYKRNNISTGATAIKLSSVDIIDTDELVKLMAQINLRIKKYRDCKSRIKN